jgi:ferredoxin
MPLETWDEYSGKNGIVSTLQPAMGRLTQAPYLGDVLLRAAFGQDGPAGNFKSYLVSGLVAKGRIKDEMGWLHTIQKGGIFERRGKARRKKRFRAKIAKPFLGKLSDPLPSGPVFIASPSIRFFDGRGANKSWLGEIPDPLTKVAWQTPVMVHPRILKKMELAQGDIIKIESKWGSLQAPIYETENIHPEILVMGIGQGHDGYGRYANGMGINPFRLLSPKGEEISGGPLFGLGPVVIQKTGRSMKLARTDGSRFAHGRKIALSVNLKDLQSVKKHEASKDEQGLSMYEFPFALPTEEGYDPKRDFYPPHKHEDYRWAMVVDLDKCIGCAACTVACYAENNVGVVGLKRVVEQREMAWLWIERLSVIMTQIKWRRLSFFRCSASTVKMRPASLFVRYLPRITPKRDSTTRFTTAVSEPGFAPRTALTRPGALTGLTGNGRNRLTSNSIRMSPCAARVLWKNAPFASKESRKPTITPKMKTERSGMEKPSRPVCKRARPASSFSAILWTKKVACVKWWKTDADTKLWDT